jgi:hypothetical protein
MQVDDILQCVLNVNIIKMVTASTSVDINVMIHFKNIYIDYNIRVTIIGLMLLCRMVVHGTYRSLGKSWSDVFLKEAMRSNSLQSWQSETGFILFGIVIMFVCASSACAYIFFSAEMINQSKLFPEFICYQ